MGYIKYRTSSYEIQRGVGVVRITKRSITEENILTRLRVGQTMLN